MGKGYILEIKTSESSYPDIIHQAEPAKPRPASFSPPVSSTTSSPALFSNSVVAAVPTLHQNTFTSSPSSASSSRPTKSSSSSSTIVTSSTLLTATEPSQKINDRSSSSSKEKYIKFTVKESGNRKKTSKMGSFIGLLMISIVSYFIFKTLNPVNWLLHDPTIRTLITEDISYLTSLIPGFGDGDGYLTTVDPVKFLNGVFSLLLLQLINTLYASFFDSRIEESVIIIPNLGLQTESIVTKRGVSSLIIDLIPHWLTNFNASNNDINHSGQGWKNGAGLINMDRTVVCNRQFIPVENIKDLIIVEGFKNFQVLFYLSLVVNDQQQTSSTNGNIGGASDENLKMIVLFPMLLPKLKLVETVWRRGKKYV